MHRQQTKTKSTPILTFLFLASLWAVRTQAQEPNDPKAPSYAQRTLAVAKVLSIEHVDRPSVHDLLKAGSLELLKKAGLKPDPWLGRLSALSTDEDLLQFLDDLGDEAKRRSMTEVTIVKATFDGISTWIPGHLSTITEDEAQVNSTLRSNRYVGVGVYIGMQNERPQVLGTFFGGPAHQNGVLERDIIYEIDGNDTATMDLSKFIEYARGKAGTVVTYLVGQPGATERRNIKMTRRETPRQTVRGIERMPNGTWTHRLPDAPVAYIRIDAISASTPHELSRAALQIAKEDVESLILDLRNCTGPSPHYAVLIADLLLNSGTIGWIQTPHGTDRFDASPDAILRDLPLAVIIGPKTLASAEWLASTLRTNGRAKLYGTPTPGARGIRTSVPVPEWKAHINLVTTWLLVPASLEGLERLRSLRPDHRVTVVQDRVVQTVAGLLRSETSHGNDTEY